jgi:hypothetical protein
VILGVNRGVCHEHVDTIGLDTEFAIENVIQKLLNFIQVLHKTSLNGFAITVGFIIVEVNSLVTKKVASFGLRFVGAGLTCKCWVNLDGMIGNSSWDDAAGHVLT